MSGIDISVNYLYFKDVLRSEARIKTNFNEGAIQSFDVKRFQILKIVFCSLIRQIMYLQTSDRNYICSANGKSTEINL